VSARVRLALMLAEDARSGRIGGAQS
jgi:hypothetical protein